MVAGRAPTAEEVKADLLPALRAYRLRNTQELAAQADKAAREVGLTVLLVPLAPRAGVVTLASRGGLSPEGLMERVGREMAELLAIEEGGLPLVLRARLAGWHRDQARVHVEAIRELAR
jgi:hypothetical protein